MRESFGLSRVTSFTEITGEDTEELPNGMTIDDPQIINWLDANRQQIAPADAPGKLNPVDPQLPPPLRGSTVAARLKAIYGSVDKIDAFVGMVAEKHIPNSSFGQLQKAIWEDQFLRVRDGDRFYYENLAKDGVFTQGSDGRFYLEGIPVMESLSDLIVANTSVDKSDLSRNVFFLNGKKGVDKIALLGNLTFNQLQFRGDSILVASTQEVLAKVSWVSTSHLTANDFTRI